MFVCLCVWRVQNSALRDMDAINGTLQTRTREHTLSARACVHASAYKLNERVPLSYNYLRMNKLEIVQN